MGRCNVGGHQSKMSDARRFPRRGKATGNWRSFKITSIFIVNPLAQKLPEWVSGIAVWLHALTLPSYRIHATKQPFPHHCRVFGLQFRGTAPQCALQMRSHALCKHVGQEKKHSGAMSRDVSVHRVLLCKYWNNIVYHSCHVVGDLCSYGGKPSTIMSSQQSVNISSWCCRSLSCC